MLIKRVMYLFEIKDVDTVYLIYDGWDDYSYRTTFNAYYLSDNGPEHIGIVKIGFIDLGKKSIGRNRGHTVDFYVYPMNEYIKENECVDFTENKDYFSLGQSTDYYKKINEIFPENYEEFYIKMNDLAFNTEQFDELYQSSRCLSDSLMRNIALPDIKNFRKIINGEVELTDFELKISYENQHNTTSITLHTDKNSMPPTNIHAIIGTNGVGKSWFLNGLLTKLINVKLSTFESLNFNLSWYETEMSNINKLHLDIEEYSFASVLGVAFSVFDNSLFIEQDKYYEKNENKNKKLTLDEEYVFNNVYKYVGLIYKEQKNGATKVKSVNELNREFIVALKTLTRNRANSNLLDVICDNLILDRMFDKSGFINNILLYKELFLKKKEDESLQLLKKIKKDFNRLSSGHKIIVLSLVLIAERIKEKTIVLIDEPETHLHPPLLSTYIRALSELLRKRNSLAIIATHSPVILQEIPKKCAFRIERKGAKMNFKELGIETFGTNIDTLTREVFGLELLDTGFYNYIENNIDFDKDFQSNLEKFNGNVGELGRMIIQSKLNQRKFSSLKEEDNN